MRISGKPSIIFAFLLLGGCGGAVKGCVIAAEHVRPVKVHVEPPARELHIRPSEIRRESVPLKKEADAEAHSPLKKIVDDAPPEIGKKAIEEAAKHSNSEHDQKKNERH